MSPAATATVPTTIELETWRNPGAYTVVLRRLDHRLELAAEESVPPGKAFTISPAEREVLQRLAASEAQDFFMNGTFEPVHLIPGSDIAAAVAANPNLLSDGDMTKIIDRKGGTREAALDTFRAALALITNPTTLQRMAAVAEQRDAPVSRVRAIAARLAELEGLSLAGTPSAEVPGGGAPPPMGSGLPRPVTPH